MITTSISFTSLLSPDIGKIKVFPIQDDEEDWQSTGTVDIINKVRIVVIGTGCWGTDYHLPGLQVNQDTEITAIRYRSSLTEKYCRSLPYQAHT
jgi:hypothetical protein